MEAGGTLQHIAHKNPATLENRARMGVRIDRVCVCVCVCVFIFRAGKSEIREFGKLL